MVPMMGSPTPGSSRAPTGFLTKAHRLAPGSAVIWASVSLALACLVLVARPWHSGPELEVSRGLRSAGPGSGTPAPLHHPSIDFERTHVSPLPDPRLGTQRDDKPVEVAGPGSLASPGSITCAVATEAGATLQGASVILVDRTGVVRTRAVTDSQGLATGLVGVEGRLLLVVSPPPPWIATAQWVDLPSVAALTCQVSVGRTISGHILGPHGVGLGSQEVRARIPLQEAERSTQLADPVVVDAAGTLFDGTSLIRRTRSDEDGRFLIPGLPAGIDTLEVSGLKTTKPFRIGTAEIVYLSFDDEPEQAIRG